MVKIPIYDRDGADSLYDEIIVFLSELKLARGGQDVYYTLNRHKKIKMFIDDMQKQKISQFENDIDLL